MDDLVINLDEYNKLSRSGRIFNVILAAAIIIFSSVTIIRRILDGRLFSEYLFQIILLFAGFNIILYTYGFFYRLSRRYVILNNQCIEYKLSWSHPSRIISWSELKKVEIKTLRIIFHTMEGVTAKMKLGEIFYSDIKKLKQSIGNQCSENGIEWSDTTVESELAEKALKQTR